MIGKLDPEDRVLDNVVYGRGNWLGQLSEAIETLGMGDDELEVVIGGSQVYEIEGDGTRWKPVKGTRKYNKDAFIVIRRPRPTEPSVPGDWEPAHDPYEWDYADAPDTVGG